MNRAQCDLLDFLTDELAGLNIRHYNYRDPAEVIAQKQGFQEEDYVGTRCWVLNLWDAGEFPHSYHDSKKGAEVEAAWLLAFGVEEHRVRIEYGWTDEWCQYKPIQSL